MATIEYSKSISVTQNVAMSKHSTGPYVVSKKSYENDSVALGMMWSSLLRTGVLFEFRHPESGRLEASGSRFFGYWVRVPEISETEFKIDVIDYIVNSMKDQFRK
jgi:hypothetical protein